MPWSRIPSPGLEPSPVEPSEHGAPALVADILNPVLVPLGFAPGQVGVGGERGQVIFCRGWIGSTDDGCVDLVLEVQATPDWHITDVRYWGFPRDRWLLDFDRDARLADQLAGLARNLPSELG